VSRNLMDGRGATIHMIWCVNGGYGKGSPKAYHKSVLVCHFT
jgi:hypothetical protein